jgi:hypothetical protein
MTREPDDPMTLPGSRSTRDILAAAWQALEADLRGRVSTT